MKLRLASMAALAVATMMMLPAVASAERRIVVEGFEAHQRTMAFQLGGSGLSLSDDTLDVDGTAYLGGVSMAFRWDPIPWLGLELGVGSYGRTSEEGLADEQRDLVTIAALWYFARHHDHRFYGVTGFSGLSTTLDIGDTELVYHEGGLVLGVGSEWMLTRSWAVNFDVRALFLDTSGEDEAQFTGDTNGEAPYPARWYNIPSERAGAVFNVGIAYRF